MNTIYKIILLFIILLTFTNCGSSSGFRLNTESYEKKLIYGGIEKLDKQSIEEFLEGSSSELKYNYVKRGRNSPNKSCFLYMSKSGRTTCLREDRGSYENISNVIKPDYTYRTEITNIGFTSEQIELDFNNHCPANLDYYFIINRNTFDNIISFLTFQLYNKTEFIILCRDPNKGK